MNPTCRRLMQYRTPCRYCVTDLRDPPGLVAEQVVIHPDRDVDQAKAATADAVKGSYFDDRIYRLLLLTPYIASGWSYGDRHKAYPVESGHHYIWGEARK